jgi:hypothetical protein
VSGASVHPLAPGEPVPGRPFAAPEHSRTDLGILREMRRTLAARLTAGDLPAADAGSLPGPGGTMHWICVPDPDALARTQPVAAVGFFGQARTDIEHHPIVEREHDIVARAARFGGLLTYYNLQLADGRYGNLVLFDDAGSKAHVTGDAVHAQAVALTPAHYRSLRLHHARLADGVLGAAELQLVRTRYLDFAAEPAWSAVREPALDPAAPAYP